MSLRVGNTFCKGPRFSYRDFHPGVCVACVFAREDKTHQHTCGKEEEQQTAEPREEIKAQ